MNPWNVFKKRWPNQKRTSSKACSRPRPGFIPRMECLEGRLLLSLTAVTDTSSYPWRAVVDITGRFPDGSPTQGSGALIENNHALTAAHVLYSKAHGGWASNVTVYAGTNGASNYFGSAHAKPG